jgi:isopenicillin N synthase-like dioxygenase
VLTRFHAAASNLEHTVVSKTDTQGDWLHDMERVGLSQSAGQVRPGSRRISSANLGRRDFHGPWSRHCSAPFSTPHPASVLHALPDFRIALNSWRDHSESFAHRLLECGSKRIALQVIRAFARGSRAGRSLQSLQRAQRTFY